jgi:hypothetical protein
MDDWNEFNRIQSTAVWLRPERPAGIGVVASWPLQERRMTPEGGSKPMSGLFAGKGFEQIDILMGELYHRLLKNGVPLSFVTSTHSLEKWQGTRPLVIADGIETESWEIALMKRLNAAGTPIIAVGGGEVGAFPPANPEAMNFFGVKQVGNGWGPEPGTRVVNDDQDKPFAFIAKHQGAPTLFCPIPIMEISGNQSELLSQLVMEVCGQPLTVPHGVASSVFSSNGSLFLILGTQSDVAQNVDVAVKPALLDVALQAKNYRVIDMDRAEIVVAQWRDGELKFSIPCAPNDGRMIQLMPLP